MSTTTAVSSSAEDPPVTNVKSPGSVGTEALKDQTSTTEGTTKSCGVTNARFRDSLGTTMVDIYVGKEKELFRVHKKILCEKIPYFDKMFNGGFKEATEGVAHMPEDHPESFDVLIEWVYRNTIRSRDQYAGSRSHSWYCIPFYNLAHKLCLFDLMDEALDVTLDFDIKMKLTLPGRASIKTIILTSPQDCGLRKYAVHMCHYMLVVDRSRATLKHWSDQGVFDVMKLDDSFGRELVALIRSSSPGTKVEDPRLVNHCVFHSHGKDDECYREKVKKLASKSTPLAPK